jgi:hypothetical protein
MSAELASSRQAMEAYLSALRQDLNVGDRLKRNFRRNPSAWYAGAVVFGLLLSKIPPLRRDVVIKGPKLRNDAPKEAGKAALVVTLLKFALDFAKPGLIRWFKEKYLGSNRSPRRGHA